MREATNKELNTLRNYLGEYTTGVMRKNLLKLRDCEIRVRSIVNNGWFSKGYITRITNIIVNTNALEILSKRCLWY